MLKTAYIFPGQGSQSVGMLRDLAMHHSVILSVFSSVSERLGYDVWALVQDGPETRLNQTEQTQVAMLTADVAVFTLLKQQGMVAAHMMAGHSLGEYAALVCAGAIDLPEAAALVAVRGQLMQATIPLGQGAMAAIVGLSDEAVRTLCTAVSTDAAAVCAANYNAIGQVVIAGHTSAVDEAISLALEQGARLAKKIPVSVPCHCPLLAEAALLFHEHLQRAPFRVPAQSVISNVDLSVYQSVEQIKRLLAEQLHRPVRWVETIELMKRQGVASLIECGPGKVLTGLVKRIDKSLSVMPVCDVPSLNTALAAIRPTVRCDDGIRKEDVELS